MTRKYAKGENTDIKFNMSPKVKAGKAMGCTEMGIPPFTQKVKNLEMLHTSVKAKTYKKGYGPDAYGKKSRDKYSTDMD